MKQIKISTLTGDVDVTGKIVQIVGAPHTGITTTALKSFLKNTIGADVPGPEKENALIVSFDDSLGTISGILLREIGVDQSADIQDVFGQKNIRLRMTYYIPDAFLGLDYIDKMVKESQLDHLVIDGMDPGFSYSGTLLDYLRCWRALIPGLLLVTLRLPQKATQVLVNPDIAIFETTFHATKTADLQYVHEQTSGELAALVHQTKARVVRSTKLSLIRAHHDIEGTQPDPDLDNLTDEAIDEIAKKIILLSETKQSLKEENETPSDLSSPKENMKHIKIATLDGDVDVTGKIVLITGLPFTGITTTSLKSLLKNTVLGDPPLPEMQHAQIINFHDSVGNVIKFIQAEIGQSQEEYLSDWLRDNNLSLNITRLECGVKPLVGYVDDLLKLRRMDHLVITGAPVGYEDFDFFRQALRRWRASITDLLLVTNETSGDGIPVSNEEDIAVFQTTFHETKTADLRLVPFQADALNPTGPAEVQ